MGAPTLADVAQAAGVSPMTVSRVINREPNVREQTRAKVQNAIARLKYSPNSAAQLLAGGVQRRIGLIYGNPSSSYLSEVLVGCLDQAGPAHVQVQLEKLDEVEGAARTAARIAGSGLHGVILPPPFSDDRVLIAALREQGMQVVILASGDPPPDVIALSIDDAQAARDMTQHLLTLGHRRIGFIAGDPRQTASARRLEGYRAALAEAGLEQSSELIAQGDYTYRSGLNAAANLIALAHRPTAIFASNDDMAAGAIAAAHRCHLEVPDDLSVCGFDDTALATTIHPELTTVRQPIAAMASEAVQVLSSSASLDARQSLTSTGQRRFDHILIVRQSTICRRQA